MLRKLAALQVIVRVEDTGIFLRAAAEAGWSALDSGARITTPDGIDREAVLLVRIPEVCERATLVDRSGAATEPSDRAWTRGIASDRPLGDLSSEGV